MSEHNERGTFTLWSWNIITMMSAEQYDYEMIRALLHVDDALIQFKLS